MFELCLLKNNRWVIFNTIGRRYLPNRHGFPKTFRSARRAERYIRKLERKFFEFADN